MSLTNEEKYYWLSRNAGIDILEELAWWTQQIVKGVEYSDMGVDRSERGITLFQGDKLHCMTVLEMFSKRIRDEQRKPSA